MSQSVKDQYERLLSHHGKLIHVQGVNSLLRWDQNITMPEGGRTIRSKQLSTLSSLAQEQIATPEVGEILDNLDQEALTDEEQAVIREIQRKYDKSTRVPAEIEEALSERTSEAHPARNEAIENDDFSIFAPHLDAIVEKKRDYSQAISSEEEPYQTLVGDFFPQLAYETVEQILLDVREELVPLLEAIQQSDTNLNEEAIHGDYDEDLQFAAARDLLDVFDYDWDRGRLDTFEQPFTFGLPSDARLSTWTDKSLYQTLYVTAHEAGHALYSQGLPEEEYGSPLGEPRGYLFHEAQAAFWENRVFAHRAFWDLFLPTLKDRFTDIEATPQEAYESANYVRQRNPEWVEADEISGQIHILLRFEIERDLVNGAIGVEEVPEEWNNKVREYFGVEPETLEEGCLQDRHWSQGHIGYFPLYTLGNVLAAQLAAALERDLGDIGELIREGDTSAILEWHRENIHQHGQRYTTPELIKEVSGKELSADDFIEFTTEKYSDLYGLS